MKTVILGAGITGLAAAYKTKGTVYEASGSPGGICRSYYENGYRFERGGGHWIFGADQEVLEFLDQFCLCKKYKRDAGVYINKVFPYPIQEYFKKPISMSPPGTMQYDLLQKFGDKLGKLFFFPFNEKYTVGLYKEIVLQDNYKNPVDNKGYNSEFIYPEKGLDALIDSLAIDIDIRYHKRVTSINPDEKMLYFEGGDSRRYDKLISTLPLNIMCNLLNVKTSDKLPYNSTIVLNIGATPGRNFPKEHWLYIPYSKSGFHRVGFYSNVDKSFAPKNRVSMYIEWAIRSEDKVGVNGVQAIRELQDWGFINKLETSSIHNIDIAYTWRYPDSDDIENLLSMVEDCGIKQIGRYGRWKFQGIADSIKEGLQCFQ